MVFDDGVYLTTACYKMEDSRKGYEFLRLITLAHNMVLGGLFDQRWTCCNNVIHHSYKHNVGSGSSQSAHIPLMDRSVNFSTRSWLQCLITMLIPASLILLHLHTSNCFKCMHLQIKTQWKFTTRATHRHLLFIFKTDHCVSTC